MVEEIQERSVIERHIQTILGALVMAILSWTLASVLDVRERLTRFEERITTMQAQIQLGTDDRFRRSDWLREKERLDERYQAIRTQLDKHHDRIEKIEREHDRVLRLGRPTQGLAQ